MQSPNEVKGFRWNGAEFAWSPTSWACFRGEGDAWSAEVYPHGKQWRAKLLLHEAGGGMRATADSPELALDAARCAWQRAVATFTGGGP